MRSQIMVGGIVMECVYQVISMAVVLYKTLAIENFVVDWQFTANLLKFHPLAVPFIRQNF